MCPMVSDKGVRFLQCLDDAGDPCAGPVAFDDQARLGEALPPRKAKTVFDLFFFKLGVRR